MKAVDPISFRHLLLIDDEPGIRRMMSLDLSAEGYQVETAGDGRAGLAAFAVKDPDIVITDLKMPGIDGIEVLRRIKAERPEAEVIVITGHGDLDLAIQSLRLGASDFLTKPVNGDALAVALDRAAERLALKAELKAYTRELEERVAEATAQALAAERLAAVGQTVAALAHSIKNMLSGLRGGAYLIEEGVKQNRCQTVDNGLVMLRSNLWRVRDLVQDLLTLAKPREPDLELEEAGDLLAETVEVMRQNARDQEVALEVAPCPEGLTCRAERKAIVDCLANLISNAIDAASTVSGGRVRLGVARVGDEVVWEVADNGPGLEPEAREHIFECFYSSKGASGTGLGLMVAQKNAREHGGRVEFDDRAGEGATFRLALPLAVEEGADQEAPAEQAV